MNTVLSIDERPVLLKPIEADPASNTTDPEALVIQFRCFALAPAAGFPNYDGNGMYLSMGNALVNPQVGLLFVDFVSERPSRLRLNGVASIDEHDELMAAYPDAQFIVRVRAMQVFPNCPRYIHRMALVERSRFVPRQGVETPVPGWKRADWACDVLPARDAQSDQKS